jgi:SET domain-containing protein
VEKTVSTYLICYKVRYSEYDIKEAYQKFLKLDGKLTTERFLIEEENIKNEINKTLDVGFIISVDITYIYKFED